MVTQRPTNTKLLKRQLQANAVELIKIRHPEQIEDIAPMVRGYAYGPGMARSCPSSTSGMEVFPPEPSYRKPSARMMTSDELQLVVKLLDELRDTTQSRKTFDEVDRVLAMLKSR